MKVGLRHRGWLCFLSSGERLPELRREWIADWARVLYVGHCLGLKRNEVTGLIV